jgi:hypothetical protein|nr:MAG TPA: hypothetical protein [Caudoviricetes sp.]
MNIAEILKDYPSGTRLYSPIYGELSLVSVYSHYDIYPICCRILKSGDKVSYTEDGKYNITNAEPTLFPSKTQRDWSKFEVPGQETKTQFKPFDKVLVRDNDECDWVCNIFSHMDSDNEYVCLYMRWKQCIPYEGNEHLLETPNHKKTMKK